MDVQTLESLNWQVERLYLCTDGVWLCCCPPQQRDGNLVSARTASQHRSCGIKTSHGSHGIPIGRKGAWFHDQFNHTPGQNNRGSGSVGVERCRDSLPQQDQLGTITVDVDTSNNETRAIIGDQGGPLQLEGLFVLPADGHYSLTAKLAARNSDELKDLIASVAFLGKEEKDGLLHLSLSGVLPPLP